MARYRGPVCKLCRREGLKLFLKGQRCITEKCSFNDRKAPPGPPPKRRPKMTGYAAQLREKQKVKRIYGVNEKPFRNLFAKAQRMKGITGENLLILLERRLDNVVYRMGIASSRAQARNLVSHGHIRVNGKRVNIASYQVKVGDEISLSEKMRSSELIEANIQMARGVGLIAEWLEMADDGKSGKVAQLPSRENVDIPIKEQVIVELYSK
ncbi:MAG: 30S ribosomal protein S4 [Candidatus Hydrogenedentota bacterium]|nr:MAG: 30S ribosomal protein S4 [Candidatus Hydrogenedentota bacterium]